MRLKAAFAAAGLGALLLAGACAPTETPGGSGAEAPVRSAEASACAARGGEMQQVGRARTWQCVVKYADAGKRCTDASQCQGQCEISGNSGIAPGAAAAGQCQADSNRFGCRTTVKDGKAEATLCID
ncbi:hypothetical protein [Brevundimonas sp. CEF1]|uniref:hypothetical protein n=1 Tax=Brevundimonas sp. CEF1 TaxID=3442642 RepID=UPI003F519B77